jgi:hypothetical protein
MRPISNYAGTIFLAIFGLFWCSFTFFFDGILSWNLVQQLRASSFPTVAGTVTHSELKIDSDGEGTTYSADVHFRYAVDRQTHEAKSLRFDSMSSSFGKERAEALVRKYRVGQDVTVHYNPAQPQRAVLELGPDLGNFFAVIFLAPFNAIALGITGGLWATMRSKQLGRPILGISLRNDGLTTTIRIYEQSPTCSALAAWGGGGFFATFGVLLAMWAMPMEYAIALGWSATLAAIYLAWHYARKKYSEIRLDAMRGRLDIRDTDGRTYSPTREAVQPASYSPRTTTDSEGAKTTKYPLSLGYLDPESNASRMLVLPVQSSADDAELFTAWLNGLLQLPHMKSGAERPK